MIDTKQLQTIGNQVAKKLEEKYPSLTISFYASPIRGEEATFVEVVTGFKDSSLENSFKLGEIDHSTAPNAYRFKQVFERYIDGYVRQFLGIK
jgi:hypothetical protein